MKNKSSQFIYLAFLTLIAAILGVGFAAFNSSLRITNNASVTPDLSDFSVSFTNTEGMVDDNTNVVPTNSSNLMTSTNGVINNSYNNGPSLSGISTNFTAPGQYVTYSLYVYNNGEYDAYLTDLIYSNVSNQNSNKICTPGRDSNNILTNDTYVALACNGISINVYVDDVLIQPGELANTHILAKGDSEEVTIVIDYASGSQVADGPFSVSFGDISLIYSTVN